MAHATSYDPAATDDTAAQNRNDRLVVVGVDRSKQFGKARRHTFIVKSLQRLLPVMTLGAFVTYVASALVSADFGSDLGLKVIQQILPENLTMNNPYYEGYTDDGGSYVVRAKTAQPNLKKPELIKLDGISGVMTDAKKAKTNLVAGHGTFDTNKSILKLDGGIDITSDDGLKAKLASATIRTKRGLISSKEPVQVSMPGGEVRAKQLRINQHQKVVSFIYNVRTTLTPKNNKPDAGQGVVAAASAATGAEGAALLGASDSPVKISSVRLRIERGAGRATFKGHVLAVQDDQTLRTRELVVTFQEDGKPGSSDEKPGGDASGSGASSAIPDASKIDLITAPEPVIMTRGKLEQLTGDSAVFNAKQHTAVIKGSVVMSSGTDRKALAELAEIDSMSDTITLKGNVVVKQGENELHGDQLFVDRANGQSRMTSKSEGPNNGQRIFAKFVRQPGGKTNAENSSSANSAQDAGAKQGSLGLTATAFKGDPAAPIKIESDRLDVNDTMKQAVFSGGNVLVEQGPVNLSTLKLTAFYSGEANLVAADSVDNAAVTDAAGSGGGAELTRIRADGNVFVKSTASGQNAKGDWADIDMKTNTVLLGGDVVLNQGKNVVRATSLKIDLTTGNAVVEASADEQARTGWISTTTPTEGKVPGGKPVDVMRSNRPSAVFYPNQLNRKGQGGSTNRAPARAKPVTTQPAPRSSEASSWEATTETPTN